MFTNLTKSLLLCAAVFSFTFPAVSGGKTFQMDFGPDGDDLRVTNGKQEWVLDADTGDAYHRNIKNDKQNSISVASFLEVWYSATGDSPLDSTLQASYSGNCGVTTWTTGTSFSTRFVSYSDGLVISFDGLTANGEHGAAEYVIQGQNFPTDWAGGHVRIRHFKMDKIFDDGGVYSLEWDHLLNSSLGSFFETANTELRLNSINAQGFHGQTNCAPEVLTVNPTTVIRWYVPTLDIVM